MKRVEVGAFVTFKVEAALRSSVDEIMERPIRAAAQKVNVAIFINVVKRRNAME
jgi:hypothetical protein